MVQASREQARRYQAFVRQYHPPRPVLRNCVLAFLVGGTICAIGQGLLNLFMVQGLPLKEATGPALAVLVAMGALLTGLGVYDDIGRIGGMGAALPISGFANAITAPALEFKREGYVFGIGQRLFQIAGPVVVYGMVAAVAMATIRIVLGLTGTGGAP